LGDRWSSPAMGPWKEVGRGGQVRIFSAFSGPFNEHATHETCSVKNLVFFHLYPWEEAGEGASAYIWCILRLFWWTRNTRQILSKNFNIFFHISWWACLSCGPRLRPRFTLTIWYPHAFSVRVLMVINTSRKSLAFWLSHVHTVAEKWDCRRKVRLSPKTSRQRRNSATVALLCDSRCFRRQIVALFCDSVDRLLEVYWHFVGSGTGPILLLRLLFLFFLLGDHLQKSL